MVKLCTLAPFKKTVEKKAHSVVRIYCFNNRVTSLLYFKSKRLVSYTLNNSLTKVK